ncbi:unnamed protein product [Vicia faba]|uniref:Disease resistance protein Roq1-like winged-helix domain-containing protein n=1 Tax=Vicia faba TaxID=3906 RepID=A0AAV0Z9N8_VICFA|nr:unnamed protein product [Vicia faba]
MRVMDKNESIELFSLNAFKQPSPTKQFAEISRKFVEYCGGLPLALEVLGSYLFESGIRDWKCVLEKIKIIPNDQILNSCGLFLEIGISMLVEQILVTVDDKKKLGMHELLRDMGREIIREKSPKEPEEHSRLWIHEDVLDVLSDRNGTKAIEGLALKLPIASSKCFSTKAFKKMKRLRLLQLAGVKLDGDFGYLSRNLRWLCWNGFPLTCIPSDFYQGNIISMELENSNMRFMWKETQRMEMLEILNLSHSHHLMQTPDFSHLPNLEKLVLVDCPMLSEELSSISKYLPNLRSLWVECSSEGQLSHDTTIILEALYATNSKKLEPTATTSQVSKFSLKPLFIQLGMNCQVANILKEKILQNTTVDESGGCVLLGDSYPDLLSFNCDGSSIIFEVPQVEGHNLKSLMCIAYSLIPDNISSDGLISVLVKNYTKATIQLYKRETLASFKDEEGERLVSSIELGDGVEVVVAFENGFSVKKTAIYLIYD